jgi:hypothetical protein
MPQSLTRNLIHLVFSIRKREALLSDPIRRRLCVFAVGVLGARLASPRATCGTEAALAPPLQGGEIFFRATKPRAIALG